MESLPPPRSYFECAQQLVHLLDRIADSLNTIESELMLMNRKPESLHVIKKEFDFLVEENLCGKDESVYK